MVPSLMLIPSKELNGGRKKRMGMDLVSDNFTLDPARTIECGH